MTAGFPAPGLSEEDFLKQIEQENQKIGNTLESDEAFLDRIGAEDAKLGGIKAGISTPPQQQKEGFPRPGEPTTSRELMDAFLKKFDEEGKLPERGVVAENLVEFAAPTIGATVGKRFGPIGAAVGAGAGRLVSELGEQVVKPVLGKKAPPFLPKTKKEFLMGDTVLGNVVNEALFFAGGEVLQKKLAPKFFAAGKKIAGKLRKSGEEPGKALLAGTRDLLDDSLRNLSGDEKERFIRNLKLNFKAKQNIPENATERVIRRKPSKVLTKENLFNDEIKTSTLKAVGRSYEIALDKSSKEFDTAIRPFFKEPVSQEGIGAIRKQLGDAISSISEIPKRGSRPVVNATATKENLDDMLKIRRNLNEIAKNPTVEKLHQLKQKINDTIGKSSFIEGRRPISQMMKTNKVLRDVLESASPGYKKITNDFRHIFELQETIGTRLEKGGADTLLRQAMGDKPPIEKMNAMAELIDNSRPALIRIWNKGLDEAAAKHFRSKALSGGFAGTVRGTEGVIRPKFFQQSPERRGFELKRRERGGALQPSLGRSAGAVGAGRAAQAGLGAVLGQEDQEQRF
jgi:hypothetical protein